MDEKSPEQENQPPARDRGQITIRAARIEDAEALNTVINLPGFRYGTLQVPFKRLSDGRKWLESLGDLDTVIVAEIAGQVVGTASLHRKKDRMAHVASIGMGVHDGFTGRGVGSALLAALLDAADNWFQIRRVELTVFTDNAPALALYRKFGFEVEGTLRAYAFRDGGYVDAHTMARLRGL